MNSDWVLLISVGVLLLMSAFFSGSETALTAASRARLHTLAQQGNRRAVIVEMLWARRERVIAALLLGNNVVNIGSSALATGLLISWFGDAGVAYATAIMTVLVVIFSEVLPKTYALHHADRAALALAPIIWWVVWALTPPTQALNLAVTLILRVMGVRKTHSAEEHEERAEEELRGAIDLHANQDEPHERQMLSSILDLAEVEVGEIMTHRKEVVAIDADLAADDIVEAVLASPYTRLPLWRGEPDNIVGVLHAKRLLRALQVSQASGKPLDILTVAQSPWFIPETTDLLAQLRAFQQRHEHFALVVDEYGVFEGVVTLEDILEEIVGEIADEHDLKIEGLKRESDGSYIVDGRLTIRDLNRQFGWRLPDEEASTIAGLVLHEARTIPQVGQAFAFHGFKFDILGRQRHQITSLRITPLQDEAASAGK